MRKLLSWLGALGLVGLVMGGVGLTLLLKRGVSAKAEPWAIEAWTARRLRHLAIPSAERDLSNPLTPTEDVLSRGLTHFADHCAACHGNDGAGDTDFGRGLYPPPPDMRKAETQELSDGELFWIIRNGVRFTGMPAFGHAPAEEDEETWQLVHFIRHLPNVTPGELAQMEELNPVSRAELEKEHRIERFLAGEDLSAEQGASGGHEH